MIEMFVIFAGYIIGSTPTGYWIGKYFYKIDITKHGSGNIGATNVYRLLGKKAGIITLCIDFLKGFLPLVLLAKFMPQPGNAIRAEIVEVTLGSTLILGHIFSVFMTFRGGKGVATSAGVFIYILPKCTLIALITWIIIVAFSRRISLGSISAAISLPITALLLKGWSYKVLPILIFCSIMSTLVICRHKQNIIRLIKGQEHKINFRYKAN